MDAGCFIFSKSEISLNDQIIDIMKYNFDLHCHPTTKSFLSDAEERRRISPWKMVRGHILQVIAPILKSQSNFTQLHKGKVKLAVYALVPIEKGFSTFWLLEDILSFFSVLDKKFIRDINYEVFTYNKLFCDEYEHLTERLIDRDKNRYVKVLRSIEDLGDDPNTIYGIIAIEGGHAMRGHQGSVQEYMTNLDYVKTHPDFSPLYLTLTHLTINQLCNHAYGAKITKSRVMKPDLSYTGICELGYKMIDKAYDVSGDSKRILLDLKHMSALARRDFYQYRKDQGYSDIPLLGTHMGVTGFAFEDIKSYIDGFGPDDRGQGYTVVKYKEVKGIGKDRRDKTDFNPWSINLYDEDIREIIASDGLIGVSLDQRILGFGRNTEEFFNPDEYKKLMAGIDIDDMYLGEIHVPDADPKVIVMDDDLEEEDAYEEVDVKGRKRRHLRYLCNNIMHIIKEGGPDAWKHICIGSDFDGLINAVNNCKTCADFPELEEDLVACIAEMAEEDPNTNYFIEDLEQQIRGFMYDNAIRFLNKYYTEEYLKTGKTQAPIA
jgi:hypothetical protein